MSDKILLICSRFNDMITRNLLQGAEDTLAEQGLKSDVEVVWVPGSFEIPVVASRAARSGKYRGIIGLGAVIKGETAHFDHVAGGAASGMMKVSVDTGIPVIFGVLTTDTVEQALNRAGLKLGNKGAEAADTLLSVLKTLAVVDPEGPR